MPSVCLRVPETRASCAGCLSEGEGNFPSFNERQLIGRAAKQAIVFFLVVSTTAGPASVSAQSLRGSRASLLRQNRAAQRNEFTYLRTPSEVSRFVRLGLLVPVKGSRSYEVDGASFPYARREVKTFIRRFSRQYREACGEKLVITSLTRPRSRQPVNSARLSVHPTGMALDLRQSDSASCRAWLEDTLLSLEAAGVVEATRERHPRHYHVAVFPKRYRRYVTQLLAKRGEETPPTGVEAAESGPRSYEVLTGDSLWSIAAENGVTVRRLKEANGLTSSRIHPGKTLLIPAPPSRAPHADSGPPAA